VGRRNDGFGEDFLDDLYKHPSMIIPYRRKGVRIPTAIRRVLQRSASELHEEKATLSQAVVMAKLPAGPDYGGVKLVDENLTDMHAFSVADCFFHMRLVSP